MNEQLKRDRELALRAIVCMEREFIHLTDGNYGSIWDFEPVRLLARRFKITPSEIEHEVSKPRGAKA